MLVRHRDDRRPPLYVSVMAVALVAAAAAGAALGFVLPDKDETTGAVHEADSGEKG